MAATATEDMSQPPQSIPGPSNLAATVADESEELAAEAGTSTGGANGVNAVGNAQGVPNEETKVEGDETEQVEDPNRIPDNACETLYIQNINEKVRIPGTYSIFPLLFPSHCELVVLA